MITICLRGLSTRQVRSDRQALSQRLKVKCMHVPAMKEVRQAGQCTYGCWSRR